MKKNDLYRALFGEEYKRESYKLVPHSMKGRVGAKKGLGGKAYCTNCGLVSLNNAFSTWSMKMGCLNELHPDYQRMRKLTRIK